ncbi:hypothetical protein ACWDV4_15980 [Micromonospora sp. NPDC003197]
MIRTTARRMTAGMAVAVAGSVTGVMLAVPAAAAPTAAPATGAPTAAAPAAAAAPTEQDFIDFSLRRQPYPAAQAIPLDKASMTSVIDKGNYQIKKATKKNCGKAIKSAKPTDAYCFDAKDESSHRSETAAARAWVPQGVTSSADANNNERWNSRDVMIIGWYDNADTQGVRITVLNKRTKKYRHVLLVNPSYNSAGIPDYRPVDVISPDPPARESVHAGGIAWYGTRLYVADTNYGVREFDLSNIYDLATSGNGYTDQGHLIGYRKPRINDDPDRSAGYYAHGYRYILAQSAMWEHGGEVSQPSGWCKGEKNPRFSYLSVDRTSTAHRLIAGEFCRTGIGRLATYNMANGGPQAVNGDWARPTGVYELPVAKIQGAASDGRYFYLNSSNGKKNGTLRRVEITGDTLKVRGKGVRTPVGPEDLSYSRSSKKLWSVTEYKSPGRMIYSIPTTAFRR